MVATRSPYVRRLRLRALPCALAPRIHLYQPTILPLLIPRYHLGLLPYLPTPLSLAPSPIALSPKPCARRAVTALLNLPHSFSPHDGPFHARGFSCSVVRRASIAFNKPATALSGWLLFLSPFLLSLSPPSFLSVRDPTRALRKATRGLRRGRTADTGFRRRTPGFDGAHGASRCMAPVFRVCPAESSASTLALDLSTARCEGRSR